MNLGWWSDWTTPRPISTWFLWFVLLLELTYTGRTNTWFCFLQNVTSALESFKKRVEAVLDMAVTTISSLTESFISSGPISSSGGEDPAAGKSVTVTSDLDMTDQSNYYPKSGVEPGWGAKGRDIAGMQDSDDGSGDSDSGILQVHI